ncbi:ComEA family DNA-binding protein [Actinomycetospora termitidis]|uniref:Helix-hairpin-helix domain-containing protein n=1 Tax=Actinomycetospora termitidis TaxID=3053470 RepID=A0ABT7MH49_9PSEU|nr:helix-hairpin-helix domain-containing protein [Actinomycetospora sp. Odt1-22]MDL5160011.1 helix-hairpin-helix domain-containing protein [Actinomycetospora sp. Odt1-22]
MTTTRPGNWFTRGGWWFLVHLLSFGVFAVIPFGAAAAVSRRRVHLWLAAAVAVLTVAMFTLVTLAPVDAAGKRTGPLDAIATVILTLLLFGGLVGLVVVRQQVYGSGAPSPRPGPDPAVSRALASRQRRAEARRIVVEDPLLARELRIGRPDQPRDYDDGGLVDLNSAPAPALASVCELTPEQAGRIVQARQAAGRFATVEDVFSWVDLPVDVWDRVRDRGVTL